MISTNLRRATTFKKIIKEYFICMDKHPKWLQEPDWPIVDNIPAMFLGQLDISKLKHDTTYLYIFWDKKNRQIYKKVNTVSNKMGQSCSQMKFAIPM